MHKRISTSTERNQAEPEECWPAGPSQSLLPTEEDRAGPQGTRLERCGKIKNRMGHQDQKGTKPAKYRAANQHAQKKTPDHPTQEVQILHITLLMNASSQLLLLVCNYRGHWYC